jgi:hypothetical protein
VANQHRIGKVATAIERHATLGTRVIYHQTCVVQVTPDGMITLDSGGWRTATTKTRMNQAASQMRLGFNVQQKAGEWFVYIGDVRRPFVDGMTWQVDGGRS